MTQFQAFTFARWSGCPAVAWRIRGLEAVPLEIGGQLAGLATLDGTEIHFALAPAWRQRAITRRRARQFLAPLIARREFLTTRAADPDDNRARFLARMGFERTRVEGAIHHYMLAALPFEREN